MNEIEAQTLAPVETFRSATGFIVHGTWRGKLAASFTTINLSRTIHHHETDPITAVRRVSRRLG